MTLKSATRTCNVPINEPLLGLPSSFHGPIRLLTLSDFPELVRVGVLVAMYRFSTIPILFCF
jgi:hypothetical protein